MQNFSFHSQRSAVYGRGGIVATSQPLATAAGLEILAKGGNAADAAVAAGAALGAIAYLVAPSLRSHPIFGGEAWSGS